MNTAAPKMHKKLFASCGDKGILNRQYLQPGNTKELAFLEENSSVWKFARVNLEIEVLSVWMPSVSLVSIKYWLPIKFMKLLLQFLAHPQIGEIIGSWVGWIGMTTHVASSQETISRT